LTAAIVAGGELDPLVAALDTYEHRFKDLVARRALIEAPGVLSRLRLAAVVTTVIPVFPAVRAVIVLNPTAIPTPITEKELLAVVTRPDPVRACVRRSSPVTGMPLVLPPHRIPIAVDPNKVGAWAMWLYSHHSRLRWRANSDSERDLSPGHRSNGQEHQRQQYCRSRENPHVRSPQ
jgi:hypothetical protein